MHKYLIFLFCLVSIHTFSQIVSGSVKDRNGVALPFATVWVSDINKGTLANEEGQYAIQVPIGNHELVFRFLGHSPYTQKVTIEKSTDKLEINIVLEEQTCNLFLPVQRKAQIFWC
jgi:hypothetical protein